MSIFYSISLELPYFKIIIFKIGTKLLITDVQDQIGVKETNYVYLF